MVGTNCELNAPCEDLLISYILILNEGNVL